MLPQPFDRQGSESFSEWIKDFVNLPFNVYSSVRGPTILECQKTNADRTKILESPFFYTGVEKGKLIFRQLSTFLEKWMYGQGSIQVFDTRWRKPWQLLIDDSILTLVESESRFFQLKLQPGLKDIGHYQFMPLQTVRSPLYYGVDKKKVTYYCLEVDGVENYRFYHGKVRNGEIVFTRFAPEQFSVTTTPEEITVQTDDFTLSILSMNGFPVGILEQKLCESELLESADLNDRQIQNFLIDSLQLDTI